MFLKIKNVFPVPYKVNFGMQENVEVLVLFKILTVSLKLTNVLI